ncbi:MAG: DUF4058 family protein [Ardenticatenaceae bacterium]
MPLPFPGMDPYLERRTLWTDVHLTLINTIRLALVPALAPRYYVAAEERTYISASGPNDSSNLVGYPDVAVIGPPQPITSTTNHSPLAVMDYPLTVKTPTSTQVRQRYLEIKDTEDDKVITVIEVLSPKNKRGREGRGRYDKKRQKVLDSESNLVEIDLLRGGKPHSITPLPKSHYRLLVSRAWQRPRAYLYHFSVRDPIPELPIPLQRHEHEPKLALGTLLAEIYDQVRYDLRIDYTAAPPPPALSREDAAWVDQTLRQAKLRP